MTSLRVSASALALAMLVSRPAAQEPAPQDVAGAAQARETAPADAKRKAGSGVFKLGEITVTAGADDKPPTDTRIGEEELQLFDRRTVSEAASLAPGVTFNKAGTRNETAVYVRGLDQKHVPLFLDGVPIYVPYDGNIDLGRFMTYDLSEVVISKGFTSLIYGPNTMGGAINLVTKRPVAPLEVTVGAGYRTQETEDVYANVGANLGRFYVQASGSFQDSAGFQLSDDFDPVVIKSVTVEDGGRRNNSYTRDWKVSGKLGWTPRAGDEYAVSYSLQRGKKGTPPYAGRDPGTSPRYWRWPYYDKQSFYLSTNTALGEKSYGKLRAYYDIIRNSIEAFDDATYSTMKNKSSFKSTYDDYTYGGSVEAGTSLIPYNTLKTAFHFKDDVHREVDSVVAKTPRERTEGWILSAALEDTLRPIPSLSIVGGVSYDRQDIVRAENWNSSKKVLQLEREGDAEAVNAQVGTFYDVSSAAKIFASVAWKTRFPSIKDLYSYKMGSAWPNPDLKPERAITYELGTEATLPFGLKVKPAGFYRDIEDFILVGTIVDPEHTGTTTQYIQSQNLGKVRQHGAEIELTQPLAGYGVAGAGYGYVRSEDRTSHKKITGVPQHKAMVYAQVLPLRSVNPLRSLSLFGSAEYNSKRYSSDTGTRVAKEFVVVNTKLGFEPVRNLLLEAGVNNVIDTNYAYDEGFPEAGRTYFVQARAHY